MNRDLGELIESIPASDFQEPRGDFARLSPLERLRWLQESAWFVWKYRGLSRRDQPNETAPPVLEDPSSRRP